MLDRLGLGEWQRPRRPNVDSRVVAVGHGWTSVAFSPDGETLAAASIDGSVALIPVDPDDPRPITRLVGLPDGGWAAIYGEHQYRLKGDPAGRFWWSSGLCRFEPGELDGYGVERLPIPGED